MFWAELWCKMCNSHIWTQDLVEKVNIVTAHFDTSVLKRRQDGKGEVGITDF